MKQRQRVSRLLIGSIGLLAAVWCGLLSLLVASFASPVQPHESGEGYGTLLVGLSGVAAALLLATASVAMFMRTARRWHRRCATGIALAFGTGAALLAWGAVSDTGSVRGGLFLYSGVLSALAILVAVLAGPAGGSVVARPRHD